MTDIFASLDALFHKRPATGVPSLWVANRFLSWDRRIAPVAAEVSRVNDDRMAWQLWRAVLPRSRAAPRLGYPAPKAPGRSEELVRVVSERSDLKSEEAEAAVEFAALSGQTEELARAYGVET